MVTIDMFGRIKEVGGNFQIPGPYGVEPCGEASLRCGLLFRDMSSLQWEMILESAFGERGYAEMPPYAMHSLSYAGSRKEELCGTSKF